MKYCVECKHYVPSSKNCTKDDIVRIDPVSGTPVPTAGRSAWWRREALVKRFYTDDCPDFEEKSPSIWKRLVKLILYA